MLAAAIGAGEQRILPVQGDRSDAALDDIGVDLYLPSSINRVRPFQRESA